MKNLAAIQLILQHLVVKTASVSEVSNITCFVHLINDFPLVSKRAMASAAVRLLHLLAAFLVLASTALSCEYTDNTLTTWRGGWNCRDGQQCINPILKCNGGTPDCDDGSDETAWGCEQGGNSIDFLGQKFDTALVQKLD